MRSGRGWEKGEGGSNVGLALRFSVWVESGREICLVKNSEGGRDGKRWKCYEKRNSR